ncbi:MAG TPA: DUF2892 domain-containing protein [Polyangiales bacterium]
MDIVRNEGSFDRTIRVVAGLTIVAVGLVARSWLGLIGLFPLVTGFLGMCPLYRWTGIQTRSADTR